MALQHDINRQGRPRVHGGLHFCTIRELGEKTGMSRRTIYRRIADGSIEQPVKINRAVNGWTRDYIADLLAKIARGEAAWQQ